MSRCGRRPYWYIQIILYIAAKCSNKSDKLKTIVMSEDESDDCETESAIFIRIGPVQYAHNWQTCLTDHATVPKSRSTA